MNKYIIERTIPGAGKLSLSELCSVSAKSNSVLRELGHDVQWVHSYVTDDKIYCLYIAKNPELVREHAKRGGFPADTVNEVRTIIESDQRLVEVIWAIGAPCKLCQQGRRT